MINNQKGVAHIFLLLILLAGIIGGVYLTTQGNPLKLFSKATNPPIVFKSSTGQALPTNAKDIPQSTSSTVKIELTSTLGPPAPEQLAPVIVSVEPSSAAPGTFVLIKGENFLTPSVDVSSLTIYLQHKDGGVATLATRLQPDYPPDWQMNTISFRVPNLPPQSGTLTVQVNNKIASWSGTFAIADSSPSPTPGKLSPCPSTGDVNDDKVITDADAQLVQNIVVGSFQPTADQLKRADVDGNGKVTAIDTLRIQRYIKGVDSTFLACPRSTAGSAVSVGNVGIGLTAPVGTVSYKIAENPTDLTSASDQPYTKHPTIIDYTFKDASLGSKFIWVEFKDSSGKTDRRSAQLEIVGSSGKPSPCPPDGDVNDDQIITDADAQLVLEIVAGSLQPTTQQRNRVDVDGDGTVTSVDALVIQKYVKGEVSTFPACKRSSPSPSPVFSGTVFIDNNRDGKFDSGDTPMANEVVILQDDNCSGQCQQDITHEIGRFTTASDGKYTFKITELRRYRITHYVPTGYIRTTDNSQPFDAKDLVDRTTITWDFGISPKLTVKGVVFEDLNRNGVLDNDEQKLPGEKVILHSIDGAKELKSMNTNSSGEYLFSDLDYQEYRITHYVPIGYVRTTDDSRPFDQKDLTGKTVYIWNFGVAERQ